MLVFPQWRPEIPGEGCRLPRWFPAERFAPYVARPVALPPPPPQVDDEDSSGSSPPHEPEGEVTECGWRGCGARFPSVARLSAHVARAHAHAHADGLFYCGWKSCVRPQRGFNARYKMLVHVRTHTNERPHTCNQCNKSFSRAENLKIHLRSHSGEKPYICPYEGCGKAYSNSSDRFKHTRTHTVDKPYSCKVPGCNKRYTDPSSLRKHVKTYKHFTVKETRPVHTSESSDDVQNTGNFSPMRDNLYSIEANSPVRPIAYSPPRVPISPTIAYNPISEAPVSTLPCMPINQVTYMRPLEPLYPMRILPHHEIPKDEMSYFEYTQMYEHAYRSYYSTVNYPVLMPAVGDKLYTYEERPRVDDVTFENIIEQPIEEEMPLNLKCSNRLQCKPIDELVRHTDLPLDLSTKY